MHGRRGCPRLHLIWNAMSKSGDEGDLKVASPAYRAARR